MQPWTPNAGHASEMRNGESVSAGRNGVHLVPCRRRSSITVITKAEEYVMKTARSELMFDKLRGRNGLMKSVLEKLRKYLKEFVTPFFFIILKTFDSLGYPLKCINITHKYMAPDDGLEGGTAQHLVNSLAKASPELKQCVASCKHIAETARQQNDFQSVCLTILLFAHLQWTFR